MWTLSKKHNAAHYHETTFDIFVIIGQSSDHNDVSTEQADARKDVQCA